MDPLVAVFVLSLIGPLFHPAEAVQCIFGCGVKYTKILDESYRYLTCSFKCEPSKWWSCWRHEPVEAPCLEFSNAKEGRCLKGKCVREPEKMEEAIEKGKNATMPCRHGHDYLYNSKGIFGCEYYCGDPPYKIVKRVDGTVCLDPTTAAVGVCRRNGYCYERGK
uniref:7DB family n=1 Tax=Argas monolakensis TaxID=34602 RepID=Q09JH2_ARGMO|nr:7DB family [Argas monolakensis]